MLSEGVRAALIQAALRNDPGVFGEMNAEKKEEYDDLVKEFDEIRVQNGGEFPYVVDIPYSFD